MTDARTGCLFSVLVPYRPGEQHRDSAWNWNYARWTCMPDAEVIIASPSPGAHPGEFNHPQAINDAAGRASTEVLVVADADTSFDFTWIRDAVSLVGSGKVPWVLPLAYHKLTQTATQQQLDMKPCSPLLPAHELEWRGRGINWSGLVVVPRHGFRAVGGYDERIAWWGADDVAFGLTMDALIGKHHRLPGRAVHFWHPQPQEETYGHLHHARQQALVDEYIAAAKDPEEILRVRFDYCEDSE